jgi:hypothetical protein
MTPRVARTTVRSIDDLDLIIAITLPRSRTFGLAASRRAAKTLQGLVSPT